MDIGEAVGGGTGLLDDSGIRSRNDRGEVRFVDVALVNRFLDQVDEHAGARGLVPISGLCRFVDHLAPPTGLRVLDLLEAPAQVAKHGEQIFPVGVIFRQIVEDICKQNGIPTKALTPDFGCKAGLPVGPAGRPGLIPAVEQEPVGFEAVACRELHLPGDLIEGISAVANHAAIARKEHLAHEHAVDPQLVSSPVAMPETPVGVAGIRAKPVPDLRRGDLVFLQAGLLVHEEDRVTGQVVVQCRGSKIGHISGIVHLLVHVPFDVVEIADVTGQAPQLFHREHGVAGLPAEVAGLPHPVNVVGVRKALDECVRRGGGPGELAGRASGRAPAVRQKRKTHDCE